MNTLKSMIYTLDILPQGVDVLEGAMPQPVEWELGIDYEQWLQDTPIVRHLVGAGCTVVPSGDALVALVEALGGNEVGFAVAVHPETRRIALLAVGGNEVGFAVAVHPETRRIALLAVNMDGTRAAILGEVTP